MIHFEIKETQDFDLVGEWKFHKNVITVGSLKSQLSDIKINNENFKKEAAQIEVKKNILLVEVIDENASVSINEKKTIGRAFLKKGDHLQIGYTVFEIKDFSYSEHAFSDELAENLKKIIRGNHPVNAIIKRLEQYLRE